MIKRMIDIIRRSKKAMQLSEKARNKTDELLAHLNGEDGWFLNECKLGSKKEEEKKNGP